MWTIFYFSYSNFNSRREEDPSARPNKSASTRGLKSPPKDTATGALPKKKGGNLPKLKQSDVAKDS